MSICKNLYRIFFGELKKVLFPVNTPDNLLDPAPCFGGNGGSSHGIIDVFGRFFSAASDDRVYLFKHHTAYNFDNLLMSCAFNTPTLARKSKFRLILTANISGSSAPFWRYPIEGLFETEIQDGQFSDRWDSFAPLDEALNKKLYSRSGLPPLPPREPGVPFCVAQSTNDILSFLVDDYYRKNIKSSEISYYYAEVDITNNTFVIGLQYLNQSFILSSTPIRNLGTGVNYLWFTTFDKPNNEGLEVSARLNTEYELTVTIPQGVSNGTFGIYRYGSNVDITNINVGTRADYDKYTFCVPPNYRNLSIKIIYYDPENRFGSDAGIEKVITDIVTDSQQYLPIRFSNIILVKETRSGAELPRDLFDRLALGDHDVDFAYYMTTNYYDRCCCSAAAGGCASYPGINCFTPRPAWQYLSRDYEWSLSTFIHEIGHNLGATHDFGSGTVMDYGDNRLLSFSSKSSLEMGQVLNGVCSGLGVGQEIEPYIPDVIEEPTPDTIEDVDSLRFDKNIPTSLYLSNGEFVNLEVDVTALNAQGNPVNELTNIELAKQCRRASQGSLLFTTPCYSWQIKTYRIGPIEEGEDPLEKVWQAIDFGTDNPKIFRQPLQVPTGDTFVEFRCIADIGGVQKISNVCKVYARNPDFIKTVNSRAFAFVYPNNLGSITIDDLDPTIKSRIASIWEGPFVHWYNDLYRTLPGIISRGVDWSNQKFTPGKTYIIDNFPDASLPYTIDFVDVLTDYLRPQLQKSYILPGAIGQITEESIVQIANSSSAYVFPSSGTQFDDSQNEIPTYDVDSSWSHTVSSNQEVIRIDKELVIPVSGITNLDKIEKIYTIVNNNRIELWKKDYEFSNLITLFPNQFYTIETNETTPFDLEYVVPS